MEGRRFLTRSVVGFLVLLMAFPVGSFAQAPGPGPAFTQEELDQMLAPIALYPDSLVAQILMAATFPTEVEEANQWLSQNQELQGDQLNAALDRMDWDLSVKALAPFPRVLAMMSDKREWTQRLGEAFLGQESDVMSSIQRLRAKAQAAGNLKSTEQQNVVVKGESIEIEPANPRVVYVPAYNPAAAYGTWWNPSYPPYAYSPYYPSFAYSPQYVVPGLIVAGAVGFVAGIAVGSAWNHGWGHWDWGHRHVKANINRRVNINRNDYRVRDVRTSEWHRLHRERAARGVEGERTGRARGKQAVEGAEVKRGKKPTPTSVQTGVKEGAGQEQVRQHKARKQGKGASVKGAGETAAPADRGTAARERKGHAKQQREGKSKKEGRRETE